MKTENAMTALTEDECKSALSQLLDRARTIDPEAWGMPLPERLHRRRVKALRMAAEVLGFEVETYPDGTPFSIGIPEPTRHWLSTWGSQVRADELDYYTTRGGQTGRL